MRVKQRQELVQSGADTDAKYILTSALRSSMETLYRQRFHLKPPLENQGSDQFLGRLFKDVAKGTLGFYPLSKIQ
eukprot:2604318-Amphidinium_carterae.1